MWVTTLQMKFNQNFMNRPHHKIMIPVIITLCFRNHNFPTEWSQHLVYKINKTVEFTNAFHHNDYSFTSLCPSQKTLNHNFTNTSQFYIQVLSQESQLNKYFTIRVSETLNHNYHIFHLLKYFIKTLQIDHRKTVTITDIITLCSTNHNFTTRQSQYFMHIVDTCF